MVSNLNVPDFAHLLAIRRNAETCLRVSINRIGFRAKETQEPKHVFHMNQLLATYAGGDELGRTCRIHIGCLWDGTPHDRGAVNKDVEPGNADL